jgi:hypothetical protein
MQKHRSVIVVRSWNELSDALFADSWRADLGRYRSNYAFHGCIRGHGDLSTRLARMRGAAFETHFLRNFRKYAPKAAVPRDSIWNWLALAQHHGLPTRLIDWSYSPFVALHFATADTARPLRDVTIYCIDFAATNASLPPSLQRVLHEEGSMVFTAEMLDKVARTLPELDAVGRRGHNFVIFLEPPSLDERIVNQFALFSLMAGKTARLDRWLADRPDLLRQVVIPSRLRLEVRDKLDQANITERVLFPGLDGLCRWLTRQYTDMRVVGQRRRDTSQVAPTEDYAPAPVND